MKLSILILTHRRPLLFERCVNSVLSGIPEGVEVLVNNDTADITEVPGATYFYERSDDLSALYRVLYERARGDHVFFLEDDDYVMGSFYEEVMGKLETDVLFFNYMPRVSFYKGDSMVKYFEYFSPMERLRSAGTLGDFLDGFTDTRHFQLSQLVFRRDRLREFPSGNRIDNDLRLLRSLDPRSTFRYVFKPLWAQTDDGRDNISFKEWCKDPRFREETMRQIG
jgi:glycosyltransferase involved in cell wall biosynthesis